MRRMKPLRLIAIALATLAPAAHALDTKRIDAAIDDAIARYGLPGIAVGVVDDGEDAKGLHAPHCIAPSPAPQGRVGEG